MKDLILAAVAILAILAAANTEQRDMQSGFGGTQVISLKESSPVDKAVPADIEIDSPNGDWGVSVSKSGEKTIFKNSVRLVHLNEAGGEDSLKTAVLK